MKIREILKKSSPDDEYLLRFVLKKSRAELLRDFGAEVRQATLTKFRELKKKRADGIPMQYIVGAAWFYGLEFFVTKTVLIPRPETEILVERALAAHAEIVIDIGTGSGAIAVSLAKNSRSKIIAADISESALKIAHKNSRRHKTKIKFYKSNLLTTIPWPRTQSVLIAANLPYLSNARMKSLTTEVRREPRLALYGGPDGLQLYKKLFAQIRARKSPTQTVTVLAEIDPEQKKNLAALVGDEKISFFKDLSGAVRLAEIIF